MAFVGFTPPSGGGGGGGPLAEFEIECLPDAPDLTNCSFELELLTACTGGAVMVECFNGMAAYEQHLLCHM